MINRQNDSAPEQKKGTRLRQRLIGGMVIVAIAALILPLWLDTGGLKTPSVQPVPRPPVVHQPEQINIPAPSAQQMAALQNPPPPALPTNEPHTAPSGSTVPPAAAQIAPAPTAIKPSTTVARPDQANTNPVPPQTASASEKKPPKEPTQPAQTVKSPVAVPAHKEAETAPPAGDKPTATGDWVVQLGSFSDELNARALAKSVEEAGFRVNISPLFAKKGTVWRVRVGPYATRDQALQSTMLLREKLGRDGLVMPNK